MPFSNIISYVYAVVGSLYLIASMHACLHTVATVHVLALLLCTAVCLTKLSFSLVQLAKHVL